MRPARRRTLAGALVGVTLTAAGCASAPRTSEHPLLGREVALPPSALPSPKDLERPAVHGKPALILVWSPSCSGCKPWLVLLDRLWRGSPGAVVVGVAVSGGWDAIRRVLSDHAIGFPQTSDPDGDWHASMQLETLPRLLLLDPQGRLARFLYQGLDPAMSSLSYSQLPYRLGLLTKTN